MLTWFSFMIIIIVIVIVISKDGVFVRYSVFLDDTVQSFY